MGHRRWNQNGSRVEREGIVCVVEVEGYHGEVFQGSTHVACCVVVVVVGVEIVVGGDGGVEVDRRSRVAVAHAEVGRVVGMVAAGIESTAVALLLTAVGVVVRVVGVVACVVVCPFDWSLAFCTCS